MFLKGIELRTPQDVNDRPRLLLCPEASVWQDATLPGDSYRKYESAIVRFVTREIRKAWSKPQKWCPRRDHRPQPSAKTNQNGTDAPQPSKVVTNGTETLGAENMLVPVGQKALVAPMW